MMRLTLLVVFLSGLISCGGGLGGTEFGNPTRELIGVVVEGSNSALVKKVVGDCIVDSAIITDANGGTVIAGLNDDCSFSIDAPINSSYLLSFASGGNFIANMIFARNGSNTETTIFYVSSGATAVDLGEITINGSRATPSGNPMSQNDRDGNGISDFEDDDDDGDGIEDDNEEDCDFDGFWDDDDECEQEDDDDSQDDDGESDDDSEEETPTGLLVEILQVFPFNADTLVEVDADIRITVDCIIDEDSIDASIEIISSEDEVVICDYSLENSDSRIRCEHEEDFDEQTQYTVSVSGLMCLNTDTVESISWSFETGFAED